jgi:hypothetical protein
MRAAHIVSVSPLFESPELGTDAFAVYTTGSDEPFVFAAPDQGEGKKAADARKKLTAELHQRFIDQWIVSLDGSPYFKN